MSEDEDSGRYLHWTTRKLKRYVWVVVFFGWSKTAERGHSWMYRGITRRDCWKLWRVTLIVCKMPRELPSQSTDLARRQAARAV